MANLATLVDNLSALTVIEAAELAKMLEEKWGVSAAAPVAVAAAGAAPAADGRRAQFEITEPGCERSRTPGVGVFGKASSAAIRRDAPFGLRPIGLTASRRQGIRAARSTPTGRGPQRGT